ncbi:MAG TPA: acyl-CoA thioesterase domain-containing protein, partial [Burkholderiales bacterium]|nr:acyl-CoA thioesterase domain-containing protein [Burkholderiales bacterium]
MTDETAQQIRNRVCRALALNRRPGFHFPGYFFETTWLHFGKNDIVQEMPTGAHCVNAHDRLDFPVLGVMIDSALSTAPRLVIEPGARMATVHLNAQFTGLEARGKLRMGTTFEGFSVGKAVPQALSKGVLYLDDKPFCHATATFVVLPPPPRARLAPLPWQEPPRASPAPLTPAEMDADESVVLAACERALARASGKESFSEQFWDVRPKHTSEGADCTVTLAPQHRNRVGHVQGGILLALAAAAACAATPRHPMLCNISSWYISPGQGDTLAARSRIVHAGRSFAVVRTEIRNADGALVHEAVSNH